MKKIYGSGFAALLCISVLAQGGCSAPTSSESELVAAPSKVTPKITITTETTNDSVAKPATEFSRTEQAPQELQCQTNEDCMAIPDPPESCNPCEGNAGQKAVNAQTAVQTMAAHRESCQNRQRGERNSQHQTCKLGNWANCVDGTCQLANVSDAEMQKRHQAHMAKRGRGGQPGGQQGGPQGGNFGGGDQGNTAPGSAWPQGYDRSGGVFPSANGNFGGNSPWANQGQGWPQNYVRQNGYPGMNPGFGSSASQPWGNRQGFGRGGAGAPGYGAGLEASGQPSWGDPGYGRYNNWSGANPNLGSYLGAGRNLGGYAGSSVLNNGAGAWSGPNASFGNSYGSYPGFNGSSLGGYSSRRGY